MLSVRLEGGPIIPLEGAPLVADRLTHAAHALLVRLVWVLLWNRYSCLVGFRRVGLGIGDTIRT